MLRYALIALAAGGLPSVSGCAAESVAPDVAVVRVQRGQSFADTRRAAAQAFFADHPDDYDMVVFWDTNNLLNGQFSYLPLANDIAGIGYRNIRSSAMFDDRAGYGTERADGLIWMGNRWRTIEVEPGPDSVLGILAEETGHRWSAYLRYAVSDFELDRLVDDEGAHWSSFLDLGDSPVGGRGWIDQGGGRYRMASRGPVVYSDLDLYTMGLLPADQVADLTVLTGVMTADCTELDPCSAGWRQVPPTEVMATPESISMEQIIAAEGPRGSASGAPLRQAFVYVVYDDGETSDLDLQAIDAIRARWRGFYRDATRGLGEVRTEL